MPSGESKPSSQNDAPASQSSNSTASKRGPSPSPTATQSSTFDEAKHIGQATPPSLPTTIPASVWSRPQFKRPRTNSPMPSEGDQDSTNPAATQDSSVSSVNMASPNHLQPTESVPPSFDSIAATESAYAQARSTDAKPSDCPIDALINEKSMILTENPDYSNCASPASAGSTAALDFGDELPTYSSLSEDFEDNRPFSYPARVERPPPHVQRAAVGAVRDKPLDIGDTWFLVGRAWYSAWDAASMAAYNAQGKMDAASSSESGGMDITDEEMTPINSSSLADDGADPNDPTPNLRLQLQEGEDYELLPEESWLFLASWYGVEGPSFPRRVIPGLVPGQERIEFYPARFHVSLLPPPFSAFAPPPAPGDAQQSRPEHHFTLSVSKDVTDLKALVRDKFELLAGQDSDLRFWRAPAELIPALTNPDTVLQTLAHEEVELVDLGETEGGQRQTIAEVAGLQTETPDIYLAVETWDPAKGGFLLDSTGRPIGQAAAVGGADAASATVNPVPLFAQPKGDFFAGLQSSASVAPIGAISANSSTSETNSISNPFQRQTRSQTAAERGSGRTSGLVGLQNLGNTCFMNSALQCLSNTKELQKYFASGAYRSELNPDNPLGQGGALAQAFGALLKQIWEGHASSIAPREFKMALSRFAPQFIGYQQQDTQELLAFLLDGLHEDLNRILKKPYIEAPDWEGGGEKEMVELARKQWDIYKQRNDSVIVDMFQGQYRSTLVSIKFDPFMYLTLPLPNMKKWKGKGSYVPYDPAKPTVHFDMTLPATATIAQLRIKLGQWFNVDPKRIVCGEIFNSTIYKWWHDYDPVSEILANDRLYFWEVPFDFTPPRRDGATSYSLGYGKTAMHPEQLESSVKAPPAPNQPAILVIFSETDSDASGSSTLYRRSRTEKFGIPFLVAIPPEHLEDEDAVYEAVIRQYMRFTDRPQDLETMLTIDGDGAAKLGLIPSSAAAENEKESDGDIVLPDATPDPPSHLDVQDGDASVPERVAIIETSPIQNGDADVQLVSEEPIHEQQGPGIVQEASSSEPADGKRMLFKLRLLGRLPTEDFPKGAEDWESCSEPLSERLSRLQQQRPLVASSTAGASEVVNDSQTASSSDNGKQTESKSWPLLYTGSGLVCVWNSTAKDHFFKDAPGGTADWGPAENFVDPEIETLRVAASQRRKTELTIDNCLDEFTKEEQLGEDDPWYCPKCKEFRQATKKFDLWEVPDILVVHLKRFSGGRSSRDKLEDFVNFPLEGLDLSDRVEGRKAERKLHQEGAGDAQKAQYHEDEDPIYDLYAVDNHYGGLGGGHYTAYAKNPIDNKWYYFDDSSVRPVEATGVQTSAAYVLFYRRRTSRSIGGKSLEKIKQALQPAEEVKEEEGEAAKSRVAQQPAAEDDVLGDSPA
ncbi:hypothetical protein OC846_001286 [Tilletia horrida]|uniref:ubiquitinyl hydrolase 1 n=1 Tax=Tilletia horrida TaxID=155126 RepID=A0AAN6GUH2_9BASI|nr:hypothetical protein OC846_001286 [Tilletia horrida]KAK0569412.1 hypothetical protein OC861_000900 [Tilletia horrida]